MTNQTITVSNETFQIRRHIMPMSDGTVSRKWIAVQVNTKGVPTGCLIIDANKASLISRLVS